MPVGAGHELRWATTDTALGGGTFGSGGVCMLGAGATTGAEGDSPAVVYGGTSLQGASR